MKTYTAVCDTEHIKTKERGRFIINFYFLKKSFQQKDLDKIRLNIRNAIPIDYKIKNMFIIGTHND